MGKACGFCLKALVYLLSLAGVAYFALQIYFKWMIDPELKAKIKDPPEHEIPFPAITICSPVFAKKSLANYNTFMTNIANHRPVDLDQEEQNYMAANTHWCAPNVGGYVFEKCTNRSELNVVKLLNESSLTSSELFVSCYLRNYMVECPKIFTRILTDYGYCYTFNMQGYHTVFNENQISEEFDSYRNIKISEIVELDNGYISYSSRMGKVNSATVYMQLNETDAMNYCVPFGRIYKVIFHLPNEIPTPFHKPYYISYDHRRVITLTAKTIKTDDALREYPPDKRGCYFEGERRLQFFNSYTKAHCDFECFANYTLNKCGCVKFSMPRTNDTPVCDLDNAHCYFYATNEWTEFDDEEDKKKTPCDCLPTCNDIKYNVKMNDVDVAFDDINDLAGFKFYDKSYRSRVSFQFLDYIGEERLNVIGKDFKDFIDEYGVPIGIVIMCTFLPIVNKIIDRFSGDEEEEEGGDGGGGGGGDVEQGVSPDQLKQDIKTELDDLVGKDVMDTIDQAQQDYELAKEVKEDAMEKYAKGKEILSTLKEVNELKSDVDDIRSYIPENIQDAAKSTIVDHSKEFMDTIQQINRDINIVSRSLNKNIVDGEYESDNETVRGKEVDESNVSEKGSANDENSINVDDLDEFDNEFKLN